MDNDVHAPSDWTNWCNGATAEAGKAVVLDKNAHCWKAADKAGPFNAICMRTLRSRCREGSGLEDGLWGPGLVTPYADKDLIG